MKRSTQRFYLGIDVGTATVRAGVFDGTGRMVGIATHTIETWRPETDFVEQSSDDIWQTCCKSVRVAVGEAGITPENIRGIGFDATCSLVVLDSQNEPLTVSPTGDDRQNVIAWMDHRAIDQARRINAFGHEVLKYVGGIISPEMESPKLLWLKENLPATWKKAGKFLDLPDFMTFRATADDTRSLCSTVCKWTYQGHFKPKMSGSIGRWDDSFWRGIGLEDFVEEEYIRIGQRVRPMGEPVGEGLTRRAADEMGLLPRTPVGVSIIDAHAGGVGMLGAPLDGVVPTREDLSTRLALIGGTSSCHMAVSDEPRYIPGVWGPYFSAMIPDMWLTEGGQSATGALIDHVIYSHARGSELLQKAESTGNSVYDVLNDHIAQLAGKVEFPAQLTHELHVLPYFHGNRSPRADPTLRGMISGLRLSGSLDDLALLYFATIQAIAHGTRHILKAMNDHGYSIRTVFACGGGTRNRIFLREHADATGCAIVLPEEPEAVLLGSAILGAVACRDFPSIFKAMTRMSRGGGTINPAGGKTGRYHDAKHAIFHRMYTDQMAYRSLMET